MKIIRAFSRDNPHVSTCTLTFIPSTEKLFLPSVKNSLSWYPPPKVKIKDKCHCSTSMVTMSYTQLYLTFLPTPLDDRITRAFLRMNALNFLMRHPNNGRYLHTVSNVTVATASFETQHGRCVLKRVCSALIPSGTGEFTAAWLGTVRSVVAVKVADCLWRALR